jgi:hypothetical protein
MAEDMSLDEASPPPPSKPKKAKRTKEEIATAKEAREAAKRAKAEAREAARRAAEGVPREERSSDWRADTADPRTAQYFGGTVLWHSWLDRIRLWRIRSLTELDEFLEANRNSEYFSWDVETRSLKPTHDNVVGHCLAFSPNEAVYVPTGHLQREENLDHDAVWDRIIEQIDRPDRRVLAFNLMFEGLILLSRGYPLRINSKRWADVMLYRWLYDSDTKLIGLKPSSVKFLGLDMTDIEKVPGAKRGKGIVDFSYVDVDAATLYAAADPVMALRLFMRVREEVESFQPFIVQLEHKLLNVMLEHAKTGAVLIDRGFLMEASQELSLWLSIAREAIYEMAGGPFNIASPPQVAQVLEEKIGAKLPKTDKGNPQTSDKAFAAMAKANPNLLTDYPIIGSILLFRKLLKQEDTYIGPLLRATDSNPHCVFRTNQAGAPTGRFSGGNVEEGDTIYAPLNGQAIPNAKKFPMAACWLVHNPPESVAGIFNRSLGEVSYGGGVVSEGFGLTQGMGGTEEDRGQGPSSTDPVGESVSAEEEEGDFADSLF